jgi:hypothetical protein
MFLKRLLLPVRNSLFARRPLEDDADLQARIMITRVRELMELTSSPVPQTPSLSLGSDCDVCADKTGGLGN